MQPPNPAREIFEHALDLETAQERAAYVREACGADAALLERVEALLQTDALAQSVLPDQPPGGGAVAAATEGPGTVIGKYKLLEPIGEGGMGVVYRAEQQEPVQRQVALKIIKLGMDTRQVVARFEAERQALALMDHPNIAKVLDGGAVGDERRADPRSADFSPQGRAEGPGFAPDSDLASDRAVRRTEVRAPSGLGRPYFVMELVEGLPITEFCTREQLTLEQRLRLFIPVCQAVQHAHQKGIIHRDLKPSNVMVTLQDGVPVPKVIDFGVAKATNQKLTEKTLFTNFGTLIGTPAYMSPEQAEMSGLDVDTRSDIYSLGVLLYELLTGTTPFPEHRLRSVAYAEMQRIILQEEPERPSTRLRTTACTDSAAALAPRPSSLSSDLDWIVMKCLEKDRDRRYETANGLAADITRHLTHEPIAARPPSRLYEFQKTLRRHKVGFTATAVVLVTLAGSVAISTWQAIKAKRAERQATQQAQLAAAQAEVANQQTALAKAASENALAARDFLIDNLIGVDCCGDAPDTDALTYEATQALVRKVARRLEGKFTSQPATEAAIRMALWTGFVADRDFTAAAEQSQRALEVRQQLWGPENLQTLDSLRALAYAKYHSGARNEGLQLITNALVIVRNGTNAFSKEAGDILSTLGHLLSAEGRHAEAIVWMSESLAIQEGLVDPRSVTLKNKRGQLANATELSGDTQKAETLWRKLYQDCLADHGPDASITLQDQFALGRLLIRQQRWREGLPLLESAAASFEAKVGATNSWTLSVQYWLVTAYAQQGDTERALGLATELYPKLARSLQYKNFINYCAGLAGVFRKHRVYEHARGVYELLREWFEKHPPAYPEDAERFVVATAATKGWVAAAEVCRTNFDRLPANAEAWFRAATVLLYAKDVDGYREVLSKSLALGRTLEQWEAKQHILKIATLGSDPLSAEEVQQCEALIRSGQQALAQAGTNQTQDANVVIGGILLRLRHFTNSLDFLERTEQAPGFNRANVLLLKAIALHGLGRMEAARAAFVEADAMTEPLLLDPLGDLGGFLGVDERTCLIYRREAEALLTGENPD